MTYRRAFVLFLVLSMLTVACGGGGGGVDLSDTGTVKFRIGGNVDEIEDTWYFFPAASAFIDGNWALTFTPNADGSVASTLVPERGGRSQS